MRVAYFDACRFLPDDGPFIAQDIYSGRLLIFSTTPRTPVFTPGSST
jgi:hypothetical protein